MNDICKACSIRQTIPSVPESLTESIWAFPFFSYVTEKEMGDAFYRFVQENPYNSSYNSHNEEGYTFTQWQIYYLSKNRHDCKPLHRSVLHLFSVLSAYPFFRDMIRLGSVRDPVRRTYFSHRPCWSTTFIISIMFILFKWNNLTINITTLANIH